MYWVFNQDQLNDAIDSLMREQEQAGQNHVQAHLDAAAIRYFLSSQHAANAGMVHQLKDVPAGVIDEDAT